MSHKKHLFFNKKRGVTINVGNKCTLACPKCHRQWFLSRNLPIRGRDMSLDELKTLAEEFDKIVFCGTVSDPIVHPNFIEFLAYLHSQKIECGVTTAVSQRPMEWWERAFAANPDMTWTFSIDGLPKDSHKYRVNQDGEKLFEVMKLAAKKYDRVVWKYIVFSYNENDVQEAKRLAKSIGVDLKFHYSERWDEGEDPMKPKNKSFYVDKWKSDARKKN